MQSFRQYRQFRTTVQAQLDRDRSRAEDFRTQPRTSTQRQRQVPPAQDEDGRDLEKGIEQEDFATGAGQAPANLSNTESNSSSVKAAAEPGKLEEEEKTLESPEDADDDDDDEDEHDFGRRPTVSRTTSQMSAGHALGTVLSGIEVRRRTTREGGDGNVFVVRYEGADDPNDPHNWPLTQRFACTVCVAFIALIVGFASSVDSIALPQAAQDFGVSKVVESMATGLFLIGFGFGALFAGPVSETVGRNPVYIATLAIYMCFILGSALAPNIGAQLVFRFLAGFFGSTPLVCGGGSISDLYSPLERVWAFPMFANAGFLGPALGPVIGGFIAQKYDWRWTEWVTLIWSGAILVGVVLFMPETYPSTLLKWKATHLRALTGDTRYRAELEIRQESFRHRLVHALYRPFFLTAREPIILIFAVYLTVIYIILFTFLDGYTYIFQETYGISQGLTGICFLGIAIGLFGASALVPIIFKWAKRDLAKIREQGGTRLPPEFRLWYAMLGGSVAVPVSLFWMGWTAYPHISIASPLLASVLFGFGILCIFITSYQYIIDSYEIYAASALASVTLLRYCACGGMVIVGIPFYENLGVHYTLTILACISVVLVPAPYVLFKYGPWIRGKSKYAVNATTGKQELH